jgi:ABC-type spermidine/putrescine transport system permease subunit I
VIVPRTLEVSRESSPRAAGARPPLGRGALPYLLITPVVVYFALVLVVPLLVQIYYSFMTRERDALGYHVVHRPTLENYGQVFTRNDLVGSLIWTIGISLMIAVGSILLGLPAAHFLSRPRGWGKPIVEMALLLPLFGDIYLAFALIYAFAPQGIVNWALMGLGIVDTPLPLTVGNTGAVIAMMFPSLSVLLMRSALTRVDPIYEEAALTLGATPLHAWFATTFSLARTGVAGALLLTFAGGVGAFTIPVILAGTGNAWITTRITEAYGFNNTPLASALSLVVALIATGTVYLYLRLSSSRSTEQRDVG